MANLWESIGIKYLTFNWEESDKEILFDKQNVEISWVFGFVETALS